MKQSESPADDVLTISVIMPVYNGIEFIKQSLPPLVAMKDRGEVLEVIVVDDTSSDATPEVARELGAEVMPSGGRLGPGAARNVAAQVAKGDVLWFIDADVIVHEDAARVMLEGFQESNVVGVFGSYDDEPPAQNFLSQYKNLVHHYYHQRARREASTFWSGCGAIRKDAFLAAGGFDVEMFKRPSIEDIELGYRLIGGGGRLLLLTDLQCTHLKEWRFVNLIHTEVFCRAIPWARLMLARGGLDDDLNVGVAERIKAVLAAVFFFTDRCCPDRGCFLDLPCSGFWRRTVRKPRDLHLVPEAQGVGVCCGRVVVSSALLCVQFCCLCLGSVGKQVGSPVGLKQRQPEYIVQDKIHAASEPK